MSKAFGCQSSYLTTRDLGTAEEKKGQIHASGWEYIALRTKDGGSILIKEASPLAFCSCVLSVEEGGKSRRFVVIAHKFKQTGTENVGSTKAIKYGQHELVLWPYEREFLQARTATKKPGDALYEVALQLLGTAPPSPQTQPTSESPPRAAVERR